MSVPERAFESELPGAPGRQRPVLGIAGLYLGALAAASAAAAGIGTRYGAWDFVTGIAILKWSAYGALAATVACVAALAAGYRKKLRGGMLFPFLGLLFAVPTFAVPWHMRSVAAAVPAIHDISTDTENPPQFVAVLTRRAGAPNPASYGGPEIAAQQRLAYPGVRPDVLSVPPAQAFERALAAARRLGWEIVDANEREGRIEATDTTLWFGFKDDIVVRIAPLDSGSRVDVRSVSRVGRSDIGMNAERIRKFLAVL